MMTVQEIIDNLERAIQYIPAERLWVNPDCGLKTRGWPEVIEALSHMVEASKYMRKQYSGENLKGRLADKNLKNVSASLDVGER